MPLSSEQTSTSLTSFQPLPASPTPSDAAHPQVIELTQRLFGGRVSIDREEDPEYPDQYFVVSIQAVGTIEELVAKTDAWHRAIREALGDRISDYRLLVDPQ